MRRLFTVAAMSMVLGACGGSDGSEPEQVAIVADAVAAARTTMPAFSVTGTVSGAVRKGVKVSARCTFRGLPCPEVAKDALSSLATTNAAGEYTFEGLAAGQAYTVRPEKRGYTFEPVACYPFGGTGEVAVCDFVASVAP